MVLVTGVSDKRAHGAHVALGAPHSREIQEVGKAYIDTFPKQYDYDSVIINVMTTMFLDFGLKELVSQPWKVGIANVLIGSKEGCAILVLELTGVLATSW